MVILKKCTICKAEKEYSEFPKNKSRKDGYFNACKICKRASDKRSYEKNREKRLITNKKRYNENKEQHLIDCKRYRDENKEKIAEYKRQWVIRNRERKREQERKWREENQERAKETQKRWYFNNKDKVYASLLKRRSLKNFVRFEGLRRKQILDRDNWKCQICEVKVHDRSEGGNENRHLWDDEFKAHIDHIIPISKGGDSTLENLRVLCRTCNLSKSDKTEIEIDESGQMKISL